MLEARTTPLTTLAAEPSASATWWLSVARSLDALGDRLSMQLAADVGPGGSFADVLWHEPSLSSRVGRVSAQGTKLLERVRTVRRSVSRFAGEPARARDVSAELASIANEERHYSHRVRELFWDAYNRDIGGD